MNKRLNITLPEETLSLIDRVSSKGQRSQLIDEAVRFYIQEQGKTRLKARIAEGAKVRARRDQELAEEWFVLDPEK
ncbi:MAG: ribbon-helix-helix domain-containing protein [Candidatus Sericytochromatia bacterium]